MREELTALGERTAIAVLILLVSEVLGLVLGQDWLLSQIGKLPILRLFPARIKEMARKGRTNARWGGLAIAVAYLIQENLALVALKLVIVKAGCDAVLILESAIADLILISAKDEKIKQRLATLIPAILAGIKWVTVLAGCVAALYAANLDPTPILGGAGIVTLILGFGAQSILKDLYSGLFILFEDYYRIGDLIEVNNFVGAVERISLRSTFLKGRSGETKIYPNGEIKAIAKKYALLNDIFITYSRKDVEFVNFLHYHLKRAGHDAWLDSDDLLAAELWEEAIVKAIEGASYVIVVISPDWLISEQCQRELTYVKVRKKTIIPLLRREPGDLPIPGIIGDRNWIFFRDDDSFEGSFRKLLRVINELD